MRRQAAGAAALQDIEKTIFVVTYGRSGSTLTQSYLNTFPDTCVRGENGNLLYHLCKMIDIATREANYVARRKNNVLQIDKRRPDLREILATPFDPWFGVEDVNPHSFERSLVQVFVDEVIRPAKGVKTIGVKEIRWADDKIFFPEFMRILDRVFPNVHFIFQSRNWEQVSRSSWWAKMPKAEVKARVESADALFRAAAAEHRRSIMIDYQELASEIDSYRRIAEFLGMSFDEATAYSVMHRRLRHCQ